MTISTLHTVIPTTVEGVGRQFRALEARLTDLNLYASDGYQLISSVPIVGAEATIIVDTLSKSDIL